MPHVTEFATIHESVIFLFIVKVKAKYQNHSEKWKTRNKYLSTWKTEFEQSATWGI